MPSTHLSLYYHVVFSTRDRRPLIHPSWRDRLYAYVAGALRTLGGTPLAVGGTSDHIHLLVGLRVTHRPADVVREIKTTSSRWVHDTIPMPLFSWQDGYGAFTVSQSHLDEITRTIHNQEEHHRTRSFQEEYLDLLQRNGVEYNERDLW